MNIKYMTTILTILCLVAGAGESWAVTFNFGGVSGAYTGDESGPYPLCHEHNMSLYSYPISYFSGSFSYDTHGSDVIDEVISGLPEIVLSINGNDVDWMLALSMALDISQVTTHVQIGGFDDGKFILLTSSGSYHVEYDPAHIVDMSYGIRLVLNQDGSGVLAIFGFQDPSYMIGECDYRISANIGSVPVPFPGTIWLMSFGLAGLAGLRKRMQQNAAL